MGTAALIFHCFRPCPPGRRFSFATGAEKRHGHDNVDDGSGVSANATGLSRSSVKGWILLLPPARGESLLQTPFFEPLAERCALT